MNREYYSSLSEAYRAMQEDARQAGRDAAAATRPIEKNIGNFAKKVVSGAADQTSKALGSYQRGIGGKEIHPNKGPVSRMANQAGRNLNALTLGGASLLKKGADQVGKFAMGQADTRLNREEIEALLNSPHLTEEEREAFIAMIEEERKDEEGMSPDEKSIGRSIKAGLNPATDHMAAATRQRLHLSQRGKKKPTAHSKETRLPAQQLKARKANDGVKEMGEEYGEAFKKGYDSTDGKTGYVAGKRLRKVSDAVTAGAPTAMQKAYKTGQSAGKALGKKLGLGEEDILSTMMDDLLDENRLTPAALEAAAAANQKRDKARGMKIHSTQGVKDLFNIKPGKV